MNDNSGCNAMRLCHSHHVGGQRRQNRRIHRAEEALHGGGSQLQAQRTRVLLQQDARLNVAAMDESGHHCRQHGNRYVAADVAEFAEPKAGAVEIVDEHAADGAHRAEDAGTVAEGCAAKQKMNGNIELDLRANRNPNTYRIESSECSSMSFH